MLVNEHAIGTDQSQKFVYVVSETNTVEYKTVKLGPVVNGMRVVREGISTNDWVVINGLMSVRPGASVTPMHADDTTSTPPTAQAKP